MRVDVNESKKIVLLWKSTAEADTPVPEEIQERIIFLMIKNIIIDFEY